METTEETDSSENTVTVNGISYVIAENFATENIPADFSETTVNYQGADYRGVSYDKGSVVMLYLCRTERKRAQEASLYMTAQEIPCIRL